MSKTIVYKDKQYLLDTKEAKTEFRTELTETMDDSLYTYLNYVCCRHEIQRLFRIRIISVLRKMKIEKGGELYPLKMYCGEFCRKIEPPPVFMVLYYQRRTLYDKYLLRLSEKTVLQITARVVKNYGNINHTAKSMDYPLPYICNGELFIFKDQVDEMYGRKEPP